MKVKEIAESVGVETEEIIQKLSNVGIKATAETVIEADMIRKLGRSYRTTIKRVKAEPKKQESKETEAKPTKEEPKEEKVEEKKPVQKKQAAKKPAAKKQEEPKKQTKRPAPKPAKPKQTAPVKDEVVEAVDEDLELSRVYDSRYSDYEVEEPVRIPRRNVKRTKSKSTVGRQANVPRTQSDDGEKVVYYTQGMTVAHIADSIGVGVNTVVKTLVSLGYMVSATEPVDRDIVELIVEDYGFELKDREVTDVTKFDEMVIVDDEEDLVERPAIVTIMGHVDHGKTTLLDTIRSTKVVEGEAGGITQHIGAYQVSRNGKYITFIDTPGHAAFTEMRARGAEVTDIVVLVVAADDGVMPQTKEAIEHAQAAKVPLIVAVNKMDKPDVNPDRIKQDLTAYKLVPEEWGGDTIYVPISALTGKGVDDLLEMLFLQAEMLELKANPNRLGVGSVIEAELDRGRGPVATLLVKNGSLKIGDPFVVGNTYGKVRAMFDEYNNQVETAGPSKPVEVTGLNDVPFAGDAFMVLEDERTARIVSEERKQRAFELEQGVGRKVSLSDLFGKSADSSKELNVIIKGDVQGSIEVIKAQLEKLNVEGVKINIIRTGVGTITETDITLAQASESIILGFNIRPNASVMDYAKERKIEIRLYTVIYQILEDIEAAMVGMLDPVFEEKVLGQAEVRQIFKASRVGTIAGCYVTDGVIERGSKVRLIRDSIIVYEGEMSTLRRIKDDVREVRAGLECGITIQNYNDIKVNDVIEAFKMVKVK